MSIRRSYLTNEQAEQYNLIFELSENKRLKSEQYIKQQEILNKIQKARELPLKTSDLIKLVDVAHTCSLQFIKLINGKIVSTDGSKNITAMEYFIQFDEIIYIELAELKSISDRELLLRYINEVEENRNKSISEL